MKKFLAAALASMMLIGGAALLFASPSYAVILHGGGMYHAGVSGGLAGLLASAWRRPALHHPGV